jgi:hypothetical protein
MSTSPLAPRLLRGAIVSVDLGAPVPSVIVFQYNPDTLTRTIQPTTLGGDSGERAEAFRLKGAPVETIKLDVEIDATEQLERNDDTALDRGIHQQLAALEMLVYPKSALVIANAILAATGTLEVIPPAAPFTLFIWGAKRVLPVRLTDVGVTEEAHDVHLNPIRARASLGLRVLSYNDLPLTHPGYGVFLAHQVVKEIMATMGSVTTLSAVAGGDVKLF